MSVENCYNCDKLFINKRKQFYCLFKSCLMGDKPYYPEKIPEDAKYNHGIKVCDFKFINKCPNCKGELKELFEFHYKCTKCGDTFMMKFKNIKKEKIQKDMTKYF